MKFIVQAWECCLGEAVQGNPGILVFVFCKPTGYEVEHAPLSIASESHAND
eukprot:CAMPEP_0118980366 /NCGR_PEP_ID=MMETSP1173-20130426/28147_1 /TAXON_ID=1034831 /ORGANISM="Rhizochromulina marina cf, Strain CCMP1243" /LENGTH=50 /DNA_ID=CAMNT_0006930703 /DNA_START=25 /DNA_END=174 /DNA_ORIENTATION=-